jgi:spore germination protein GerM
MIVMKRAIIVALTALALGATAGGADGAASRSASLHLYFLGSSGRTLTPVVRTAPTASARVAVAAILAGPNRAERTKGLSSAVPRGVRLVRVRSAHGRASVALRGSSLIHLSTIPRLRMIASLTYTLTSLTTIRTVRFTANGRPWGVYNHQGQIIRDYQRGTLSHPWLTACAPAHGCFAP